MSTTTTPTLELVKPTPGTGEYADVSVINGNMDKIDAAVVPMYVYSSLPAQASLPTTPCYVLDTSDKGLYYNDGL